MRLTIDQQYVGPALVTYNPGVGFGARVAPGQAGCAIHITFTGGTAMKKDGDRDPDLARAVKLSEDHALHSALLVATRDERSWAQASRDPQAFLRSQGVDIPDDLSIRFIDGRTAERPIPEFDLFMIRQFNCRTIWRKKMDGVGYERITICLGFEIVRRTL